MSMKTERRIMEHKAKALDLLKEGQNKVSELLNKQESWEVESSVYKDYSNRMRIQNTENNKIRSYIDALEWVLNKEE